MLMTPTANELPVPEAELLAVTAIAIDVEDPEGRHLRVSPACAALLGLRRHQRTAQGVIATQREPAPVKAAA
jgi:PAS domain-containing protein